MFTQNPYSFGMLYLRSRKAACGAPSAVFSFHAPRRLEEARSGFSPQFLLFPCRRRVVVVSDPPLFMGSAHGAGLRAVGAQSISGT